MCPFFARFLSSTYTYRQCVLSVFREGRTQIEELYEQNIEVRHFKRVAQRTCSKIAPTADIRGDIERCDFFPSSSSAFESAKLSLWRCAKADFKTRPPTDNWLVEILEARSQGTEFSHGNRTRNWSPTRSRASTKTIESKSLFALSGVGKADLFTTQEANSTQLYCLRSSSFLGWKRRPDRPSHSERVK